jgi:hypothetical protein
VQLIQLAARSYYQLEAEPFCRLALVRYFQSAGRMGTFAPGSRNHRSNFLPLARVALPPKLRTIKAQTKM